MVDFYLATSSWSLKTHLTKIKKGWGYVIFSSFKSIFGKKTFRLARFHFEEYPSQKCFFHQVLLACVQVIVVSCMGRFFSLFPILHILPNPRWRPNSRNGNICTLSSKIRLHCRRSIAFSGIWKCCCAQFLYICRFQIEKGLR